MKSDNTGCYLNLVLNAHLPFVRHPEEEFFRQENWLFDALSETYLPLLRMLERLEKDNISFRLTLSLSPPLVAMLNDEFIQDQYLKRLNELMELGQKEVERTRGEAGLTKLAEMYQNLIKINYEDFIRHDKNILKPIRAFQRKGLVEIVTTTATHCYLPLYQHYPQVLLSQIRTALEYHESVFGHLSQGLWLPECGYFPGLEEVLNLNGIKYFIASSKSINNADPYPRSGLYEPVQAGKGVSAFPLERTVFRALYSPVEGYPAHSAYRDFFRDIGYELPSDYISSYMGSDIGRVNTGFKYFCKNSDEKSSPVYNRKVALAQSQEDAHSFVRDLLKQQEAISPLMGSNRPPLISCAYDAELFGHWWFEGLDFLEKVIREIDSIKGGLEFVTPSEYLKLYPENQPVEMAFGSLSESDDNQALLDGSNDWIYRHTHSAVEIMTELANRYPDEKGLLERTLNQAARETLLSQASDWPFILNTGTATSYAKRRIKIINPVFFRQEGFLISSRNPLV